MNNYCVKQKYIQADVKSLQRVTILNKYFSLLLVLYPVLHLYSINGFNLGYLCFFAGIVLFFIYNVYLQNRIMFNPCINRFFCYMAIVPPFMNAIFTSNWGQMLQTGTWLFLLYVIIFSNSIEKSLFLRYYKIVVYMAVIFFLFQEIVYYTSGNRISGIIPFLDFSFYQDRNTADMVEFQQNTNRSSSFFMEPAMFAQFLLPALIMNMKYTRKNCIAFSGLILVFLLLRSGIGLLASGCCVIIVVVRFLISDLTKKIIVRFSLVTIALCIGLYVAKTEYGEELLNRTSEFDASENETSGFVRVIRGYYLFSDLKMGQQFFGVGTKNLETVINDSRYAFMFGEEEVYLNGIQAILVGGGYLGLSLFLLMLYSIGRKIDFTGKMMLWIFLVLSLAAATYLSSLMLLYMILAYSFKKTPIYGIQNIR